MKQLLLITFLFFGIHSFSQINPCVPDVILQDSTFGLWPDTIENLPLAVKDVYYEEHIQIKTPGTVGEVMGENYQIDVFGVPVNISQLGISEIKLVEINGLPDIMSTYISNSDSIYVGDDIGCVTLFGTPSVNELGEHNIEILIDGTVNVPGLGSTTLYEQLNQYEVIDGYKLIVQNSVSVDNELNNDFDITQNIPNPFSDFSVFELYSTNQYSYQFVIVDLMGRTIHDEQLQALAGLNTIKIDANSYTSGIYFYSVSDGQSVLTKKLIITDK